MWDIIYNKALAFDHDQVQVHGKVQQHLAQRARDVVVLWETF